MKSKSEVKLLFQIFHKIVSTQYNSHIQVLRSDNKGEYKSSKLQQYLEAQVIIH